MTVYSAIGGIDFEETSTEYSITGTGSVSNVSAPVIIIDDHKLEGSEGFFGNLEAGAGFAGVANVVFSPNQATAEIIDDDGRHLLISYTTVHTYIQV